jgi:DNA-directed RNA polymerase specialized sigma24 family protein
MSESLPGQANGPRFPTTCWSRVVAASDRDSAEAGEALGELCRAYWYPLYSFVRRKGHAPEDAKDLTQSYISRLLEKGVLAAADRDKGRFRAFLRTDLAYFLADRRDHDRALKRGGGVALVSIDAGDPEGRLGREPADPHTPDHLFDRDWAVTLLDRVLDGLEREYVESGRSALFARLKVVLTDGANALPYAAIAAELGLTELAVQSAVQRLKRRYRDIVRDQIAATLEDPSPADVDDEIRSLFATLGR